MSGHDAAALLRAVAAGRWEYAQTEAMHARVLSDTSSSTTAADVAALRVESS